MLVSFRFINDVLNNDTFDTFEFVRNDTKSTYFEPTTTTVFVPKQISEFAIYALMVLFPSHFCPYIHSNRVEITQTPIIYT